MLVEPGNVAELTNFATGLLELQAEMNGVAEKSSETTFKARVAFP